MNAIMLHSESINEWRQVFLFVFAFTFHTGVGNLSELLTTFWSVLNAILFVATALDITNY